MNQQAINEKARNLASKAGEKIQKRALDAAGVVDGARRPARKLNTAGNKLNDLSHRFYARLLEQQIKGFEDVVTAGATRLKLIGNAGSLRELVQAQIALFPANRERFVGNLRVTADIIGGAGREIASLAKATVTDMSGHKPVRKAAGKPAKKTATKTARKVSKKATVRKKTTSTGSGKAA